MQAERMGVAEADPARGCSPVHDDGPIWAIRSTLRGVPGDLEPCCHSPGALPEGRESIEAPEILRVDEPGAKPVSPGLRESESVAFGFADGVMGGDDDILCR
jgi:hypothetical protein